MKQNKRFLSVKQPKNYYQTKEKQQEFVERLFSSCYFTSLEELQTLTHLTIQKHGGKSFMGRYYSHNIKKLLTTLYPHFPWSFENTQTKFEYFSQLKNQLEFMERLFIKFELKSLGDWEEVSKTKINQNGGVELLRFYYSNDMKKLLKKIYPNFPWSFDKLFKFNSNEYFHSIENQRKFMENLFIQLKLKSIDDWKYIPKQKIIQHGGRSLLVFYYSNDFEKLLSTIYPNHHWNFDRQLINTNQKITKENVNKYFKSINNQQLFFDQLFYKLKLNSLDDWEKISKKKIIQNGGYSLLLFHYFNNKELLLSSIYPYYPWSSLSNLVNNNNKNNNNNNNNNKNSENNCNNLSNEIIEIHRNYMNNLYDKLKLTSMEEWYRVPRRKITNSGRNDILSFYSNDKEKLLSIIYPNFEWKFDKFLSINNSNEYFKSIKNQRIFMENLFKEFKLNSLDDWKNITKTQIIKKGGKSLIYYYYKNDLNKLLSSIYPNHHWNFENNNIILNKKNNFLSLENQQNFLIHLFNELKLNSLEEFKKITKTILNQNGGFHLLSLYSHNLEKLFSSIFPNYPWQFEQFSLYSFIYFQSFENQKKFMDDLFEKWKMTSLDDWLTISRNKLINNKGRNLIVYHYKNDINQLLLSIYQNYPWSFAKNNFEKYLSQIDTQRKIIEEIFVKLKLNELNDWLKVTRSQMLKNGGRKLLNYYENNMQKLLKSIYPFHHWQFGQLKFQPNINYKKSIDFNRQKLQNIIKKFNIKMKKDWYRLLQFVEDVYIYSALKLVFPDEKWDRSLFAIKSKKSSQRILFLNIQTDYPSYLLIENYRHPSLFILNSTNALEFDIFIPALNVAFEYQGVHHYEDNYIFANAGYYQIHDKIKHQIANESGINLTLVPFWWDGISPF